MDETCDFCPNPAIIFLEYGNQYHYMCGTCLHNKAYPKEKKRKRVCREPDEGAPMRRKYDRHTVKHPCRDNGD